LEPHRIAVYFLFFTPDFFYLKVLLEQVDCALGTIEHFLLSLAELRKKSVFGLSFVKNTFLLGWLVQFP
jgi:hypothetical protein